MNKTKILFGLFIAVVLVVAAAGGAPILAPDAGQAFVN